MAGSTSGEHHILRHVLVIAFSLAIVLLGAKELHKKHFSRVQSRVTDPKELISELRDDADLKKMIVNPKSLGAENKVRTERELRAEHTESLKNSVEKLVP